MDGVDDVGCFGFVLMNVLLFLVESSFVVDDEEDDEEEGKERSDDPNASIGCGILEVCFCIPDSNGRKERETISFWSNVVSFVDSVSVSD